MSATEIVSTSAETGVVRSLSCHPNSPFPHDLCVTVTVQRGARVFLCYQITGNIAGLAVPPLSSTARKDELWRHTCAELFAGSLNSTEYIEYNFSPASEWAAYSFADYRQGMKPLSCDAPVIVTQRSIEHLQIEVELFLPEPLRSQPLQLGLTLVLEDNAGQCSYWALQHGAAPDFHQRAHWLCAI